jgi:hypothetical protein
MAPLALQAVCKLLSVPRHGQQNPRCHGGAQLKRCVSSSMRLFFKLWHGGALRMPSSSMPKKNTPTRSQIGTRMKWSCSSRTSANGRRSTHRPRKRDVWRVYTSGTGVRIRRSQVISACRAQPPAHPSAPPPHSCSASRASSCGALYRQAACLVELVEMQVEAGLCAPIDRLGPPHNARDVRNGLSGACAPSVPHRLLHPPAAAARHRPDRRAQHLRRPVTPLAHEALGFLLAKQPAQLRFQCVIGPCASERSSGRRSRHGLLLQTRPRLPDSPAAEKEEDKGYHGGNLRAPMSRWKCRLRQYAVAITRRVCSSRSCSSRYLSVRRNCQGTARTAGLVSCSRGGRVTLLSDNKQQAECRGSFWQAATRRLLRAVMPTRRAPPGRSRDADPREAGRVALDLGPGDTSLVPARVHGVGAEHEEQRQCGAARSAGVS